MKDERPLEDRLRQALEGAAAFLLLAIMLLVPVDVVGRSALNMPVPWSTEVLEVLIASMVFLLYPVLALQHGHITVDLITVRSSLQMVQRLLASGIGVVVFGLIAGCMARQAVRAAGYGEASPILGIPLGLVLGGMSLLSGVCALAFLVAAVREYRRTTPVPKSAAHSEA